jgi:two-component system sensor histidine kinase VicK
VYKDVQRIGNLSKDGVFIYNLKTAAFLYINEAFADIFAIGKERLMQKPALVLPFLRTEDTFYLRHRMKELERKHTIVNAEFRLYFDDGNVKHLSCDAYLMEDNTIVTGFVKDFSKEKEHEDFIVNYGAKKDTLLDMLTHNLSGPLYLSHNILNWLQEQYKDKAPGEISAQLRLIQDNTKECLDIVNDFLRQEHMESQRIYVKKTRFDVIERITATLDKIIATNKNKKFQLITNLENLNINTDSVKFFQAIHNLVSNAIKFTSEHGQIDILVEETDSTFIVRVRDNGIGIPTSLHPLLFDKRTSSARKGVNNESSSGLGLSIVKALVELLDGKVFFESKENGGSVFSIELPKD